MDFTLLSLSPLSFIPPAALPSRQLVSLNEFFIHQLVISSLIGASHAPNRFGFMYRRFAFFKPLATSTIAFAAFPHTKQKHQQEAIRKGNNDIQEAHILTQASCPLLESQSYLCYPSHSSLVAVFSTTKINGTINCQANR